ncbi:hypothetical protein [Streptomyces natalensis]
MLMGRNCHKSHRYGLMLAGAQRMRWKEWGGRNEVAG